MKLKQIRLSGFKSFVENTQIEVTGQLVGIVGPNGCGKSNVIDAVRWVLGESSAKQLRGESMADVIFNGSLQRKPVSRASVELVFDNALKSLNGLWNNYDEVAIKRVISRQGESSYLINNQQVRRKDITDLFLGTGVGSKGYAVIEQGMISRIIESRPEDMRLFIEEAAGVSKYRERRKETVQRLSDTRENLVRLEDIHSEIIKQLSNLEEQAKTARLYQELNQELKQQQALVLAIKIRDAERILGDASQFIQNCEDELRTLGYQLEEVNESLVNEQELKLIKEKELQDLMGSFNECRTTLARVEERYKHYTELLQRFETESIDLNQKSQDLEQDIVEQDYQIVQIEENLVEKQTNLSEEEIIREEYQLIVADEESAYQQVMLKNEERQNKLNQLKRNYELLEHTVKHKQQQYQALLVRKQRLHEDTNTLDLDQNYHFLKDEIELVKEEIVNSEINSERTLGKLEEVIKELTDWEKKAITIDNQIAAVTAKTDTLTQLLQQSTTDIPNFGRDLQELREILKVEAGYEFAVELALGVLLKAKLTDNIPAKAELNEAQIALWFRDNTKIIPVGGSLSQYVRLVNMEYSSIYGYLNKFILVKDVAEMDSNVHEGVHYITQDGHLFTKDYVIYNATNNINNILIHQQELEKQLELSDRLEQEREAIYQQITLLRGQEQSLKNDSNSLQAAYKRLFEKKHNLEVELTKQEQIYVQNQRHMERTTQEINLADQEIIHLSDELTELNLKLEEQGVTLTEFEDQSSAFELEKIESETAWRLAQNKLNDFNSRINQLVIDLQMLRQQKSHILQLKEEKQLQISAIKANLARLNDERDSFNNTFEAEEISKLQQTIAEIASKMQTVQRELDEVTAKIVALKNKASSLNSNYQRNLEKINQTKFKVQEQQILRSTYQESSEEHGVNVDQVAELLITNKEDLSSLSEKAKKLEAQINELGLVNLKAIEDLELASAKEHELVTQLEDLRQAITNLETAISHIDNETRSLLQVTFDQLNSAIQVYFKALFGGGSARLALTEKDILVAGVQIFAEPPGKKNSTIHLLSGGEKALAAMSFIFALFSLNPAPFCLLDEVDAPLDDANTSRFCNLVKELASKTQFVYISHNRLAMEMADQLVGVTMQEKGVSTVVSVSLVDAVNQIAAS